jgi:peptidoglycan hydrolase-like protein with peptidoglycan-binding domain
MKRLRFTWPLGLTLTLGIGCGHARTVEPAVPAAEADKDKKDDKKDDKRDDRNADEKTDEKKTDDSKEGAKADEAPAKKTAATFTSHHKNESGEGKGSDTAVSLSTSPTALLKPGALKNIQEKLASAGTLKGEPSGKMDAATQKALVEFQRDHGLPATGVPDDVTVGRLGLKPSDIFRAGPTP